MELPRLQEPPRYVGLYVVDFKDHVSVGFTAEEVSELLESERYARCKVYKVYRACPDGRLELKGVSRRIFQMEAGLFFHGSSEEQAAKDFNKLASLAEASPPPCRVKIHLAAYAAGSFVVALIYPAEYDDEVSRWLLDSGYVAGNAVAGGTGEVSRYYGRAGKILQERNFHAEQKEAARSGSGLMAAVRRAVQR